MNKIIKLVSPFVYLLLQVDCDPSVMVIKRNIVFYFFLLNMLSSQRNHYCTAV